VLVKFALLKARFLSVVKFTQWPTVAHNVLSDFLCIVVLRSVKIWLKFSS